MDRAEIQARLDQAKEKVDKRITTINKLCSKLRVNSTELLNDYHRVISDSNPEYLRNATSTEIVSRYVQEKPTRAEDGTWLDDNYEWNSKVNQLIDNLPKLFDLEKVVKGWEIKLDKQTNRENIEQIPILVEFLNKWEENAKNYYIRQSEEYVNAYNEFHAIAQDWLNEHDYNNLPYSEKRDLVKVFNDFIQNHYGKARRYRFGSFGVDDWVNNFDQLTKDLCSVRFVSEEPEDSYHGYDQNFGHEAEKGHYELRSFNEEKLDKLLHEEKLRKYQKLVEQVTAITGPITDVSGLEIDARGDLNGIVIGEKGKAKVNTIGAGGYNIQVFHYRTLVKPIQ